MAPRGRRNKVGLGRMDAALDAMIGFGFPKEVVRRKVKQLLKVYDGDAGWPFIEEASYKLLIDSILEDQEESQEENAPPPHMNDGASQDEVRDEDDAHPPSLAGPSTEPPNDDVPYAAGSGGVNDVAGSSAVCLASGVHEASPKIVRNELQTNGKASVEEEGRSCWRDIALDKHSSISHMDNNTGNSPTKPTPSQEPMADLPKQRRKPSYGWISDGDDEETELLDLPSLVLPFDTMVGRTERSKKRKSRWDERPYDM